MTPDVNVLVAASRVDHPQHAIAQVWLRDAIAAAARGAPLLLLPMVAAGFLRIVTQARIFRTPTPPDDAASFLRALLGAPGVDIGSLGPEWPRLVALCEEHDLTGADVTDAWIASAVLEHHEHLVTFDRGFRRFLGPRDFTVLTS